MMMMRADVYTLLSISNYQKMVKKQKYSDRIKKGALILLEMEL